MGLDNKGYRRRTFDEIVNSKIAKARELFGEDIDTSETTVLGKYIRINAYDQYKVEELAELTYYSIFPQTAFGTSLDRLGWIVGISRNPALSSTYNVQIKGTPLTSIPAGFLVGTEAGINFYTTSDSVIGDDGIATVLVQCTSPGEIGNVIPSNINIIIHPAAEIDSVIGTQIVSSGVGQESDTAFRKRFDEVKDGLGSTNEAAIRAALIKIPTVEDSIIAVDEANHKFTCYVKGGENYHAEIAETIFDKKPIGISTDGNISVLVSYGSLTDYEVKFSHVSNVNMYVKAAITTNTLFESTGEEDIIANLKEVIDATEIGKKLIFTSLYGPIYKVPGVVSVNLEISTDGINWVTSDIVLQDYESCSFKQLTLTETRMV